MLLALLQKHKDKRMDKHHVVDGKVQSKIIQCNLLYCIVVVVEHVCLVKHLNRLEWAIIKYLISKSFFWLEVIISPISMNRTKFLPLYVVFCTIAFQCVQVYWQWRSLPFLMPKFEHQIWNGFMRQAAHHQLGEGPNFAVLLWKTTHAIQLEIRLSL